jgi:hypothetical protein
MLPAHMRDELGVRSGEDQVRCLVGELTRAGGGRMMLDMGEQRMPCPG